MDWRIQTEFLMLTHTYWVNCGASPHCSLLKSIATILPASNPFKQLHYFFVPILAMDSFYLRKQNILTSVVKADQCFMVKPVANTSLALQNTFVLFYHRHISYLLSILRMANSAFLTYKNYVCPPDGQSKFLLAVNSSTILLRDACFSCCWTTEDLLSASVQSLLVLLLLVLYLLTLSITNFSK